MITDYGLRIADEYGEDYQYNDFFKNDSDDSEVYDVDDTSDNSEVSD